MITEFMRVPITVSNEPFNLFTCLSNQTSNQNQKRSNQEMSLLAQDAVNEFEKLLTLLDGPAMANCKRIRKGPLPNSCDIKPLELMDTPDFMPGQCFGGKSTQPHPVRQSVPLEGTKPTAASFPANFCQEKEKPALQRCYYETNVVILYLITELKLCHSSQQPSMPSMSLSSSAVDKQVIRCSFSKILACRDEPSMCSSTRNRGRKKNEEGASTGRCHCSKSRKPRIKKNIQVPALSNMLADIPPDDYSCRKYVQKPMKGSPHPSVQRSYYKCSSMRGCPARKHVEGSLENPTMLLVTYEGDHNHSNFPSQAPTMMDSYPIVEPN